MRRIFTSQSPPWIAASLQETLSCITEPTNKISGKANQSHNPYVRASIQSPTPKRTKSVASTKATMRLLRNSTPIFHGGIFWLGSFGSGSLPCSLTIASPSIAYQTPLNKNAAIVATKTARRFTSFILLSSLEIQESRYLFGDVGWGSLVS
jgi:hypothetical protein